MLLLRKMRSGRVARAHGREVALYEAQAVLAFNLEPKEGVAYIKSRLGKHSDDEIGEWLAQMSTQKGGLDPTMLGSYFSRRDTLDIFRAFVRRIDFEGADIVAALRKLFDTFKPGGEGQVITRILEMFAEAYFVQWRSLGGCGGLQLRGGLHRRWKRGVGKPGLASEGGGAIGTFARRSCGKTCLRENVRIRSFSSSWNC